MVLLVPIWCDNTCSFLSPLLRLNTNTESTPEIFVASCLEYFCSTGKAVLSVTQYILDGFNKPICCKRISSMSAFNIVAIKPAHDFFIKILVWSLGQDGWCRKIVFDHVAVILAVFNTAEGSFSGKANHNITIVRLFLPWYRQLYDAV